MRADKAPARGVAHLEADLDVGAACVETQLHGSIAVIDERHTLRAQRISRKLQTLEPAVRLRGLAHAQAEGYWRLQPLLHRFRRLEGAAYCDRVIRSGLLRIPGWIRTFAARPVAGIRG